MLCKDDFAKHKKTTAPDGAVSISLKVKNKLSRIRIT